MKIRKLFQRAAAFALAAVTALSAVPATTAFAAGDIGTISFTHTYDGAGNAIRYNSSANIGGHTAGGTGEYKYRMYVDGETAFCLQPGVPLKTGNTLAKASSNTWNALSADQKKAVGLALLYGYQGNSGAMTRNGLPRRPLYGSSSRDAVIQQARTARQARPFTACTLARTMQTAGRGRLTTRLCHL